MATLVNKMNREVKVIIPNMREFRTFYSDNEGVIGMFFKRDWEEETTKEEEHWKSSEDIDVYELAYERYPIKNALVREVTKDINEDTRDGFIDGYKYCNSTHWKPSEEQMRYLLAVINNPNNAGAESCHLTLESIYNDLKKLK